MPLQSVRPVPELLEAIVFNVQDIIRSEVRLAKTEIVEDAAAAAKAAVAFGAGLILACWALGFVLLAAVYALSLTIEPWLASLVVGLIVGVAGIAMLSGGVRRLKNIRMGPDKTERSVSVKETVQWVKDQTK